MPTASQRLRDERDYHDRQARQRAVTFGRRPELLRFRDADYLDHETWIRPAMARLGDVAGYRVLDWGCGHGMAAVVLARRGATVTAVDISAEYLAEVKRRAAANDVTVSAVAADAARLPFAAASFDAIWGHAILHHLDPVAASAELRRVLRPGGVAVLCEPWGGNPLVRLARRWLPYPGKGHTPGERPLSAADMEALRRWFGRVEWRGYQLCGAAGRWVGRSPVLEAVDRLALVALPALRRYCRYVVVEARAE